MQDIFTAIYLPLWRGVLVQHYHRQQKNKKTTPVAAGSPYTIAQHPEVACIAIFSTMLEPTVSAAHMEAASRKITVHIP
jgi:hypothetical protein